MAIIESRETLYNAVREYAQRGDITEGQLDIALQLTELQIDRAIRIPTMERVNTISIVDGSATIGISVPAGVLVPVNGMLLPEQYLEAKQVLNGRGNPLRLTSIDLITRARSLDNSNPPDMATMYARQGDSLLFDAPVATEELTGTFYWYSTIDRLSTLEPTETTNMLEVSPRLFLYGMLYEIAKIFREDNVETYREEFARTGQELLEDSSNFDRAGGLPTMPIET